MVVFICDVCTDTIEVTENIHVFAQCWAVAKEDGWRIKDGEHLCPSCADLS